MMFVLRMRLAQFIVLLKKSPKYLSMFQDEICLLLEEIAFVLQ